MLKVNLINGKTVDYDLVNGGLKLFEELVSTEKGISSITALSISANKTLHTMPKPRLFGEAFVKVGADLMYNKNEDRPSAEVIWYQIGNLKISYIIYLGFPSVTKINVVEV